MKRRTTQMDSGDPLKSGQSRGFLAVCAVFFTSLALLSAYDCARAWRVWKSSRPPGVDLGELILVGVLPTLAIIAMAVSARCGRLERAILWVAAVVVVSAWLSIAGVVAWHRWHR